VGDGDRELAGRALFSVEGERIVARAHRYIRPPRSAFEFTWCHGITWTQVRSEPTFGPVWLDLLPLLDGADFIAAHNASFDKSVLSTCCAAAGIAPPPQRFECTVKLARKTWDLRPTTLPHVCTHLGISLQHHEALSDAEACARIVLAAGVPTTPPVPVKAAARIRTHA
jgi:DNA polymerase-3 subunit epsilon